MELKDDQLIRRDLKLMTIATNQESMKKRNPNLIE
jgi:hypothetical protein